MFNSLFSYVHLFIQRYHSPSILEFLLKVFPCGKYIINHREDLDQQVTSSVKYKMAIKSKESLKLLTQNLIKFAQSKSKLSTSSLNAKDQFFFVPLESFHNLTLWNQLFQWLERPQCHASGVLRINEDGYSVGTNAGTDTDSDTRTGFGSALVNDFHLPHISGIGRQLFRVLIYISVMLCGGCVLDVICL